MNTSSADLKLNSGYGQIWRIAYPIMIGSLAQNILAFTDVAFLGRVGESELAAIGYVTLFYLLLFTIGYGYTKGTQILVARRAGEGNRQAVGEVVDNSFLVITLLGVGLFILLKFFGQAFFSSILNDETVVNLSVQYLEIRAWGVVFSFLGTVLMSFYMGLGRMKIIIWSVVVMSGMNVVLNWILIFGHFGFPALGIEGAAIASTLAEIIAFFILAGYSVLQKHHVEFGFYRLGSISRKTIIAITDLSAPIVGQFIVGLGAWFTFFTFIEKLGSHELAISNIIRNLYSLAGLTTWGLASAANTVVSNLIGQGLYDEIPKAIKRIVILSLTLSVLISSVLLIFPATILRVYTNDFQIIADSVPVLYVCIVAMPLFSISSILFNGIVSTGLTKVSLLIEMLAISGYLAYIYTIILVYRCDVWVAWTSEWVYWTLIGSIALVYLKSGKWRDVRI